MTEFYINSVKSNLNWKKLDVSDIEMHQKDDKIQFNASKKSLRDNFSDDLKIKLHDEFSHILNFKENLNKNIIEEDCKTVSYLDKASNTILEIEKIAGIGHVPEVNEAKSKDNSDELLLLLNELRTLTEKRSKISNDINFLDNSLIKLQQKFLDKKRDYDKKISDLESMSSIYTQSATLVSKIISEDTDYEKI